MNQKDQKDQMNQIAQLPATRREMGSGMLSFFHKSFLIPDPNLFVNARSAEATQQQRCWTARLSARLGKPQLRQRRDGISPTDIRNDVQLEHRDRRELDVMIFRLARCAVGTEVPLLPYDFPERLPAIRRPTQDVLLRALSVGFREV